MDYLRISKPSQLQHSITSVVGFTTTQICPATVRSGRWIDGQLWTQRGPSSGGQQ